ncbi:MAG TPA: hypothetical protein VJP02_30295 [Candidatus Sulfotelmatobacter sp.]|nr:hypothetical protein [Candidatus Sulfotelmatobacter sp.]
MDPVESRGKVVRSLVLLFVLAGLIAVAEGQHDKKGSSSPPPRPAPHVSAPAQHAPANRTAPTNRPPTNTRPSSTVGSHPNTNMGNRPNNATMGGRTNTGTTGRPGSTTMGRPGGAGNMNRPGATGNAHGPMGNANANGRMATRPNTVNRPLAGRQVSLRGGGSAVIRPNGQIRTINRNGMQINHGINGNRTIVSTHNGARVVTTGRNSGYVQRAYVTRGGRTYVSRTVVVNHVTYTSVYRSYSYGGYCCYYGYHPAYYYAPVYYGWAYNPWPAPVYYGWGWGGAPWYGYYGGYFAPYPVYPSAAFWLTDYLISANLQAAYEARAAARAAAANGDEGGGGDQQQSQPSGNDNSASNSAPVTLTPEVKEAIAEEVKAQLAAQQAEAQQASSGGQQSSATTTSQEVPAALDPARHTFIVASDLTVSSNGQECQLTAGDVIKRTSDTPDDDRKVTATVSASKKSDCAAGQEIAIGVDDLQEMHNKFEEQLDNGMKDLSSKQGQNGLPKAPETKTVPSDVPTPPPDNSAAKTLEEQQSAADQTESQVVKEAFSQGS